MSQEYFPTDIDLSAGEGSSKSNARQSPDPQAPNYVPDYMVVGSGTTSENAESLIASLHDDSGYGGSVAGEALDSTTEWHAGLMQDHPTPSHTPLLPGQSNLAAQHERQAIANHVHQLQYNANRTQLGRSITKTLELLKEFQRMNRQWPAHYPSVISDEVQPHPQPRRPNFPQARSYEDTTRGSLPANQPRPGEIRRAVTSVDGADVAEGSSAVERRSQGEPRLLSAQVAREFSILGLDLKLGAQSQAGLVHSLEKASIASLMDGKISQSIKHLLSLRDRIEDTSSKVLVTGDLNAGKSTFCNALLRRKVLPEDQQPCTSLFCEVLDARENGGVEEVHAIHKDTIYNRNDESTYDVYALKDLEDIVVDNTKYMQCKVYVKDVRAIDQSLLNNGVVDIALIDAPGLNSDSVKTTAVFARQEEIDVVVFVVSAANHFTMSSREFIMNAAREKAYIFIVVNGFDNIRDTNRCQRMILEQISGMSPRTYKESAELVHFVSSNAVPTAPAAPGDGDDDGDDDSGKGKGKGKEKEKIQDFENLEQSLRRFVLEKRSRSKLAPARTYLLNILADLHSLADANCNVASSELHHALEELEHLEPAYEKSKTQRSEISEQLQTSTEESREDVYNYTRSTLSKTISNVAQSDLGVDYSGIFSLFQYAEDLKLSMLDQITAGVTHCEEYARAKTVKSVNMIQSIGLLHVGEDKFPNLNFRADVMFRQKRHGLVRQITTDLDIWDFIDIPGLWERQEKVAGTGVAMTVVGVVGGRALGGVGWLDGILGAMKILGVNNARRMLLPGIIGATALAVAYIASQIPTSLPSSISRKIATTLAEMDYVHSNAHRISSEVARVLQLPATRLQTTLQAATEELSKRKDEKLKVKHESEVARKYFSNLFRESDENRRSVEQIDLEAQVPGLMAA